VPFTGALNVHAKSECRTDRRHYREVLTARQAQRIQAAFAREIEFFGYDY
jgi:hypothetical protein